MSQIKLEGLTVEDLPSMVLDDRAGTPNGRGTFRLAEPHERVARMPASEFGQLQLLAVEGAKQMEAGNGRAAYESFIEAIDVLDRVPEPFVQWNATGWILLALGENAVRAGLFDQALQPLNDAIYCPGGLGNPWLHLRIGQVRYELGEMEKAADELARAYIGAGREIFQGQDPKYFALVESVLRPPPGYTRLP